MAIKGSLQEASLPDVLQLLAMGQKTGCLSVTDRANFGNIYFDRGRITYASIVNRKDRLGELLVKNGLITTADLESAIEDQMSRPNIKLGEILIEQGSLGRDALEDYVRLQIEEAVYLLFTWSQGSFYFEAGQKPETGALLVSINPENLLLEGARRIDEWSIIEKQVPSLDVIFKVERDPLEADDFELSAVQRKILPLLEGDRTVQEIVEESGLIEFDVAKAIFELARGGFAKAVGTRQKASEQRVSKAKIDEHRNLGVAFYRTGMYEEATREFRHVVELQPDHFEARFFLGLVSVRAEDDRAAIRHFKELVEKAGPRGAALHNLALVLERMGRLDDALTALDAAARFDSSEPRIALSRAIVTCKLGKFDQSIDAFERYRELIGDAAAPESYYVFAIVSFAARKGLQAARQLIEEGIERYPHSAALLMHSGLVRERSGDLAGAEEVYARASREDATLAAAHKARGDMLYRRAAYDEAAEAYTTALDGGSIGDDVYFKLGNIHYKKRDREKALELWRKALEINPDNTVVRTNLELVDRAAGS